MNQFSDIQLIIRVTLYDDVEAFSRLVEKHQSALRRFLLNLTKGNKALSDDLAQENFIKVYINLNQFKLQSKFKTWLFRIGYNTFYDFKRTQKTEVPIDSQKNSPIQPSPDKIDSLDLYKALKVLNQNENTCIILFYMKDLRIQDIAKITLLTEGTIKSCLSRGRSKLAKFLKENGYESYR